MEQKILIVDDESHIRMLIEQTLEELEDDGVEFLTAENGEIALNIIQKENPQLVFLDVMMPKMNGMLLFQQVEALGAPSFACGFNIWDDDRKTATAWMAGNDRLQPPFKTSTAKDIYPSIYKAEQNGESLFIHG